MNSISKIREERESFAAQLVALWNNMRLAGWRNVSRRTAAGEHKEADGTNRSAAQKEEGNYE